jgi:hypothetical protein
VLFEWDPVVWEGRGEDSLDVFRYLSDHGYEEFAFFADNGFFYGWSSSRETRTLRSLRAAALARAGIDNLYFDVLSGPPDTCQRAVELNVAAMQSAARSAGYGSA